MAKNNTKKLLEEIEGSLFDLYTDSQAIQNDMYEKVLTRISELDYGYFDGKLLMNRNNSRVLGAMKADLDSLLKSSKYKKTIKKLGAGYITIEELQKDYFSGMVEDFKPSFAANTARQTAVTQAVEQLIGGGVNQAVTQEAGDILLRNIQSGANIRKTTEDLRQFITKTSKSNGALAKYSGQIATDSMNQYAASYNEQVTEDLGFEWYQYVGSVRDTTRDFCAAMVEQRYIHKSELAQAAQGNLRIRKVSTAGMYPKTSGQNILTLRGGYNCKHQFRGVATKNVPKSVRSIFNKKSVVKEELDTKMGTLDRLSKDLDRAKEGGATYNILAKTITKQETALRSYVNANQIPENLWYQSANKFNSADLKYESFTSKKWTTKQFEASPMGGLKPENVDLPKNSVDRLAAFEAKYSDIAPFKTTREQRKAIIEWADGGSVGINKFRPSMRNTAAVKNSSFADETREWYDDLTEYIDDGIKFKGYTYRGQVKRVHNIDFDVNKFSRRYGDFKPGNVFSFDGIGNGSTDIGIAESFAGMPTGNTGMNYNKVPGGWSKINKPGDLKQYGVIKVIEASKSMNAVPIFEQSNFYEEKEYLYPPGTVFEIEDSNYWVNTESTYMKKQKEQRLPELIIQLFTKQIK